MLLGIIFFIVGIVVFFEPGGTYLALSVLFGIVVILSGAFELYLGTKAPTGSGMGWYIAGGVVEILLGILLLCTPSMLFTILPFVLGFWLLFRGFMAVGVASEMMGVGIKGAGWTMTLGILVIISAFLVLFNPIIGVGVVVFWVGLSLLLAGVDLIAHAVTLRRLRKELLSDLHPADIAELCNELSPEDARFVYLLLDNETAADVLVEMDEDVRKDFLEILPSETIAKRFVDYMDTDDAVDLIREMGEEKQEEIISHIEDIEQAWVCLSSYLFLHSVFGLWLCSLEVLKFRT
jgi:uncharacterized membrane protein HdeD (DUF308 family)